MDEEARGKTHKFHPAELAQSWDSPWGLWTYKQVSLHLACISAGGHGCYGREKGGGKREEGGGRREEGGEQSCPMSCSLLSITGRE